MLVLVTIRNQMSTMIRLFQNGPLRLGSKRSSVACMNIVFILLFQKLHPVHSNRNYNQDLPISKSFSTFSSSSWMERLLLVKDNTDYVDYGNNINSNGGEIENIGFDADSNLNTDSDSDANNDNGENDDANGTDIQPHNKICRNYLKEFLQGTTDSRDECQGLQNAYNAADCANDIEYQSHRQRRDRLLSRGQSIKMSDDSNNNNTDNGTNDDDHASPYSPPSIDDFFEEFECCDVMRTYYSSRCHYGSPIASLSLLGVLSVLLLCGLCSAVLHSGGVGRWGKSVPHSAVCILVGAAAGMLLQSIMPEYRMRLGSFDDALFLYILLPPIIFSAALSIDKPQFRRLLFPVTMFAVFGTLICAILTGYIVHKATSMTWPWPLNSFKSDDFEGIPLLESMVFGALISSVDPVGTLATLTSAGVATDHPLYVLISGESLLNDAVSITMFESLVLHLEKGSNNGGDDNDDGISDPSTLVKESIVHFLYITFLSVAIGLGCAFISTLYFRLLKGKQSPVAEVATFFFLALLPYYVADGLAGSGIVAILVAGMAMDILVRGRKRRSDDARLDIPGTDNHGSNSRSCTLNSNDGTQSRAGTFDSSLEYNGDNNVKQMYIGAISNSTMPTACIQQQQPQQPQQQQQQQ